MKVSIGNVHRLSGCCNSYWLSGPILLQWLLEIYEQTIGYDKCIDGDQCVQAASFLAQPHEEPFDTMDETNG